MSLPNKIKAQLLARFDELIVAGEEILNNPEDVPPLWFEDGFGQRRIRRDGYKRMNGPKFVEWRVKATTLLSKVIAAEGTHSSQLDEFSALNANNASLSSLETGISFLRAIKDDFEEGLLDNLLLQIEAEMAADYMGQAERLMIEGSSGKYDHVPAAVLAGAVLEKALKKMCDLQQPPISTKKASGESKTLNPLIDDLKQARVFNELKAKQLRGWADIRNKAAHGEFDQFKKEDVEQMIVGISTFLPDYLR